MSSNPTTLAVECDYCGGTENLQAVRVTGQYGADAYTLCGPCLTTRIGDCPACHALFDPCNDDYEYTPGCNFWMAGPDPPQWTVRCPACHARSDVEDCGLEVPRD